MMAMLDDKAFSAKLAKSNLFFMNPRHQSVRVNIYSRN